VLPVSGKVIACGTDQKAGDFLRNCPEDSRVIAESVQSVDGHFTAEIRAPWGCGQMRVPLPGFFNFENALLVLSTLCVLGVSFEGALDCIAALKPVPGRMQLFGGQGQPVVIVDYAHKPDALLKVLSSLREQCQGRLHCVFGCGGDRDAGKRPLMGEIAEKYADSVGSSNAVNLTDGLDGLAVLPAVMVAAALGVFAYVTGNINFAKYLALPYVPGTGELVVFCGSLIGAGLGFLWFNTYPAEVFMGDVGSLALGAALGVIAVIVRQELVLLLMGGIFVIETLSVILQVASFKLTGRRIFRMAPIHHHFELKGWPEPRVFVRFWIVTFILVLAGLATLKLR